MNMRVFPEALRRTGEKLVPKFLGAGTRSLEAFESFYGCLWLQSRASFQVGQGSTIHYSHANSVLRG